MRLEVVFHKENARDYLVRECVEVLSYHYDEETNKLLMEVVSIPSGLYLVTHNVVSRHKKQFHVIGYGVRRITSGFGQVILTGYLSDDRENKMEFKLY